MNKIPILKTGMTSIQYVDCKCTEGETDFFIYSDPEATDNQMHIECVQCGQHYMVEFEEPIEPSRPDFQ